jgi:colicin import membrane protein
MNARTAMPLLLVVMTAGSGTLVSGQIVRVQGDQGQDCNCNNTYIMDSASGKEVIETHTRGHYYQITSIHNKTTELYIDDKKIAESEYPKYAAVVEKIEFQVREDERQGRLDREQGERDRKQGELDRAQGDRDREQGDRDREQGERDRKQGELDREQGERDREQGDRDREQGERDREQGQWDRQQAADDRAMMRSLVSYIVTEGIVPNTESLKSMVLTDTAFIVNGVKQSEKLLITLKDKFGVWARNGLSYGDHQAHGTTVFFYKENFE